MNRSISDKHSRMYLKVAKVAASPEHNSCLSRSVGAVLVKLDRPGGRIVNTGYNGPVSGLPRCDSEEHLREMVWPQLTEKERNGIGFVSPQTDPTVEASAAQAFASKYAGCGQCPRKIIGAKSGERLELCSCAHAERNAVIRCTENLEGAWMFCWCGVPCHECSTAIIQAGIRKIVCIRTGFADYSSSSRWMLRKAGVTIEFRDKDTLDVVETLNSLKEEVIAA